MRRGGIYLHVRRSAPGKMTVVSLLIPYHMADICINYPLYAVLLLTSELSCFSIVQVWTLAGVAFHKVCTICKTGLNAKSFPAMFCAGCYLTFYRTAKWLHAAADLGGLYRWAEQIQKMDSK